MNAAVAGFLRLINGRANHIPNLIGVVPAILQISAVRHSAGANDITAFAIALRDHRDDFAGSKVNRRYRNLHELSYPLFPGLAVLRTAEAGKIAVLTPLYLGFCQPVSRRLFPARQAQSPIQYTIFHYKPFFSGMQVLSGVLNVFRRHFYPIFRFCGADDDCSTPSAAHKPDSPRPSASVFLPFCPLPKAPCGR